LLSSPTEFCLGHRGIRSGDCKQEKIPEAEGEASPRCHGVGWEEAREDKKACREGNQEDEEDGRQKGCNDCD
jgi:hypothetical protein